MRKYPQPIVEMMKRELEAQLYHYDVYDKKATFLFGAILVTLGLLLNEHTAEWVSSYYWIGMALFGTALFLILYVIMPRRLGTSPKPSALLKRCQAGEDVDHILGAVADSIVRNYDQNVQIQKHRAVALKTAFWLIFIGLVLVSMSFILAFA